MSTNTQERRFAYNHNTVDGYPCPAVAAGYNPDSNPEVCEIAEQYDNSAYTLATPGGETLPEHDARQAWEQTIRKLESLREKAKTEQEADYWHELVDQAYQIADELGW